MTDLVKTHNETKDLDLEKIVSVPSHEEEIDNRLDVETYLSILSPKQKDRLERWKLCGVRSVGDQVGCSAQAAQQTIYLAISRIRRRFRRELREAQQRPARRDDRDRGSEDRERLRDFASRPRNKAALGAAGVTS